MNLFSTREQFIEYVGDAKPITLEEFKKKATFQTKGEYQPIDVYIENVKKRTKNEEKLENDIRLQDPDYFLEVIYNMFIVNRENVINAFYKQFSFNPNSNKSTIKFNFSKSTLLPDNCFDGRVNKKHSKVIKNMFFNHIYNTPKYNTEYPTMIKTIQDALNNYKYGTSLIVPSTFKIYERNDVETVLAILRGSTAKLSVFNPYTVLSILNEIEEFHGKSLKKMVTPTLGWCSYLLGFMNSNLDEYVGIDVIDEVVEKGRLLGDLKLFKSKKGGLKKKKNDKKVTLYSCPSEKLDEVHDFSNKYKEHFDISFCSPPYFNLEYYENGEGEQSVNSFSDYREWLKGYWEETVKIMYNSIRKDGYFVFVISNYTDDGTYYEISQDMKEIVSKYFEPITPYNVLWGGFTSLTKKAGDAGGIKEDCWVFQKK